MKRRLFNLMTAASLALCLATAGLWVRAHWTRDLIQFPNRRHCVGTDVGEISIHVSSRPYWAGIPYQALPPAPRSRETIWFPRHETFQVGESYSGLGFVYMFHDQASPAPGVRITQVTVPLWFPVLLLSVAPAVWQRRRLNRHEPGQCKVCGYDLRATPDRCPECGSPVAPPAAVPAGAGLNSPARLS